MGHVSILLFALTNLACLSSGVALGIAIETWRRSRR